MNQTQRSGANWVARVWPLVPIVAALLFTSALLLLFGASPAEAYRAMWDGSFGGTDKILGVIAFWVPLVPVSYTHLDVYKRQLEKHNVPLP